MTKTETELNNFLNGQGWAEGAASAERVNSLLDRLNGRMAQLALADVELQDFDDNIENLAA